MTIRVLQLSDLEIASRSSDEVCELLLEEDLWQKLGGAPVDYIICCGNITADANPESFLAAERVLGELLKKFLKAEEKRPYVRSYVENRVLLLPGRRDLAPAPSLEAALTPFSIFYSRFHSTHHSVEACFSVEEIMVRELKDLTIIAIPFWNKEASRWLAKQRRDSFLQLLSRTRKHLTNLDYCNHTPTILVSPESPDISLIRHHRLSGGGARPETLRDLGIDFHLFGASPIWCVFEPFVFRHAGLSTGPRNPGKFFPVRLNLLEFSSQILRRIHKEDDGRSRVSVTSFEKITKRAAWSRERIIDGSLDAVPEGKYLLAPEFRYHEMFSEQLMANLKRLATGSIALEYLPGQGVEMELALTGGAKPKPEVVFEDAHFYDEVFDLTEGEISPKSETYKSLKNATERLLTKAKAIREQTDRQSHDGWDVICVLRDKALTQLSVDRRRKWLGLIREHLKTLENERIPVVYATTPSDSSADVRDIFRLPMVVPQLGSDSLQKLLNFYGRFIPMEPSRFERWCGRFVGLWNAMLEAAEDEFRGWPGAVRLDLPKLRELPKRALLQPKIQDLLDRFVDSMKTFQGWHSVYSYLRDLCSEAIDSDSDTLPSFSIRDILDRTGENQVRVRNVLEILVRLGVMCRPEDEDLQEDEERFAPGALLFFLQSPYKYREDAIVRASPTGKDDLPVKNPNSRLRKYRFDVFISYRRGGQDEIFASELDEMLRNEGFTVAIDQRAFKPGGKVMSEIVRCTRQSRCTVALVSARYPESAYTKEEFKVRDTLDKVGRRRRLAPILTENLPERPDWLFDLVTIDWTSPEKAADAFEKLKRFILDAKLDDEGS